MPKHEAFNYVEFPAKDLKATKQFFIQAFGWEFTDYGNEYTAFSDGVLDGGFYKADLASKPSNGAALMVFYSDDIHSTLEKVVKAGGTICKPIFDFPGGCRFHFLEPSGNELAVWANAR
jgi:predicted enzyme related to lactoylglutathione lyase